MKVLVIVGSLKTGGQEKMSAELSKLNDSNILFDFVVYHSDKGAYEDELLQLGYNVIHINYPKYNFYKYYKIIKKINLEYGPYDVVHCHGVLNNGVNIFIAKLLNIPKRISHCHSSNNGRKSQNLLTQIYQKIMKSLILKYSTDLIACGKKAGEYLYGKEFLERGLVIPNGIAVEEYKYNLINRKKIRKEIRVSENQKIIGIVARLSEVKNHLRLLDIFKEIVSKDSTYMLAIVGNGEMKEHIVEKIKEKKLSDNVIMLGDRQDICQLLSAFDFFILPSLFEGFPVSLIEAQANGLICFVSNNISTEVDITNSVKQFKLTSSDKEIANLILSTKEVDRSIGYEMLKKSIYNIEYARNVIKEIYYR